MKKILTTLLIALSLLVTSCEVEPPTPDCELYNYGTVTVRNETGFKIEVDVTWGNYDVNDERILYNNGNTTYREVPAGRIYLWVSTYINEPGYTPFWTDWDYNSEYLSACEDFTYRWYTAYWKKSTSPSLMLDIIKDGKVIKTVSEFERGIKQ